MQWEKAIEAYEYYLRLEKGLSENSIKGYKYDVKRLMRFSQSLQVISTPITMNTDSLKQFIYVLSKEIKAPSQSRIISGIKEFFNYLYIEGYRKDNPTLLLETPKIRKTFPDTLAISEVDSLIKSIQNNMVHSYRNKCILELLYSCGLRVSEVTKLKCSDLFFEKRLIRVRGKGNKLRWVPIANSSCEMIKYYLKNVRHKSPSIGFEDIVFLNNRGKELTRVMIFTIVKKASFMANIKKKISPHTLRHSFATHLVENGADIQLVQHMLGHSSITTTERYIHMSQRHLKEVINKFHPRRSN
jgi:integrase/recombinase XerD